MNHPTPLDWRTTYPSLAAVQEASFETICTWCDHLPPPQTDVERTVLRRLTARRDELMRLQLREKAPDVADKLAEVAARLQRMGIKSPFDGL